MIHKIEKLSKVLSESYSEKSLIASLGTFFEKNFDTEDFSIDINNKTYLESPIIENDGIKYPIFKHKKSIGYRELTFFQKIRKKLYLANMNEWYFRVDFDIFYIKIAVTSFGELF